MKNFQNKLKGIVGDVQNRVAQNPTMNSAATGASNTASSMFTAATNFAKGVTQGHSQLKATFANITNAPVPRAEHSISVVKGRAYIFGGVEENGQLADNDMYMVILPSGGVLDADFTNIEARAKTLREGAALDANSAVPSSRKGHTTVVVGDNIYLYGGEDEKGQPVDRDHPGRVWTFDTTIRAWSALDPGLPDAVTPPPRSAHGAASSEHPGPIVKQQPQEPLPQQPRDPAKTVPDVPDKDSWGTLIISGGRNASDLLDDAWSFDIRTRTWTALPTPPAPARTGAALAIADHTLFRFGGASSSSQPLGGGIDILDLSNALSPSHTTAPSTPLSARTWVSQPYLNGAGPRERSHPGLATISTGQGRSYLLLLGGSASPTAFFDDVWTYQLTSSAGLHTAAGLKDATLFRFHQTQGHTRDAAAAQENAWAEVRYQYTTREGEIRVSPDQGSEGDVVRGKGVGSRGGFAVASGTEVDGASVVVWGGRAADGRVLGDGWLVTVERW